MSMILPQGALSSAIRSSAKITLIALLTILFSCPLIISAQANSIKFAATSSDAKTIKAIKIGVSAIVEHPSLQAIADGVRDGLEEAGFELGKNLSFTFQTAQNRQATLMQIAHKFVGDKVDVVVPIGTAAAQAALNASKNIPIVFTGVSDPVAAGLISDPNHPDKNITGLSDLPDVEGQIGLIKSLLPNVRNIGFLYNPSEPNSLSLLKLAKKLTKQQQLSLIEAPALQTSQVRGAALSLIGKVDAIYIGTDNTVISALESALMVANQHHIPIIVADSNSVERGALACFGNNYYSMGKETAKLVLKLLQGTPIKSLPVQYLKASDIVLNNKTAQRIGFTIPDAVRLRASVIIE